MTTAAVNASQASRRKPVPVEKAIYPPKPAGSRRYKTKTSSQPLDSTMKASSTVKRTRASVPRPRSGCQTCKRRHVKCDETKPECTKCLNTGRKCDGYAAVTTKSASRLSVLASTLSIASYEIPFKIPGSQNDRRIFHYYCVHAAADLALGSLPSFWNTLVLQCSQDEPVVRSALLALSYEHLDYVTREFEDRRLDATQKTASLEGLQQNHKALRQLRKYIGTTKRPSVKAVLVCCLLFYYFECSRGDHQTALLHLRNGLAILGSERAAIQSFQNPDSAEADADLAQLVTVFSLVDTHVSLLDFGRMPELDITTEAERTGNVMCQLPTGKRLSTFDPTQRTKTKLRNWAVRFMITNQRFKYSCVQNVPPSVVAEKIELERQIKLSIDTVDMLYNQENAKPASERDAECDMLFADYKACQTFLLMNVQSSIANNDTPFRVPNPLFNNTIENLTALVHMTMTRSSVRADSVVCSRFDNGEQGESSGQDESLEARHLRPPRSTLRSRSASPSPLPDSTKQSRIFSSHGGILAMCLVLAAKTTSTGAREHLLSITSQCTDRREGPYCGRIVNKVLRSLEDMEAQYRQIQRAGNGGPQGEEDISSSDEDDESEEYSSDSESDSPDTTQRFARDYADQLVEGRPFCVIAACLRRGNHGERCCWCDDTRAISESFLDPSLEDIGARMIGGISGFERLLQSRLGKKSG